MRKYIISIIAGFALALLLLNQCSPKNNKSAGETKIDTVYQVKEKLITIKDNKPIVKYIYKDKLINNVDTIEVINDSIKFWKYTMDTTYQHKYGTTQLKQKGWGYVEEININTILKDTTTIIIKEITKLKPTKGVYVSTEYLTPFNSNMPLQPTYKVNADFINSKWIVGTSIGIQNNQPIYGVRIGVKVF